MRYVIPDAKTVLRVPDILTLNNDILKLILLPEIIEEIESKKSSQNNNEKIIKTINEQIINGTIEQGANFPKENFQIKSYYTLTKNELALLKYCAYIKNKSGIVYLVSEDKTLINEAKDNDIQHLNIEKLLNAYENIATLYPKRKKRLSIEERKKREEVRSRFRKSYALFTLLYSLFASLVVFYPKFGRLVIEFTLSTLNVWGTISAIVLFGVGLFIVRERYKKIYGIVEFCIGVYGVSIAFPDKFDYSKIVLDISFGYKIAGGLYIIVRGLDNIVKGMKDQRLGKWLREKMKIGL